MGNVDEIIELLNPWWKDDEVSEKLAKPYKRKVFNEITRLINYRQIVILSGLRRVGKTTSFYQIIQKLLKKTNAKNIFYFNFDKEVNDINEILDSYQELSDVNWKKEKIFVFLDEITKLNQWASKIKLIYDAFPNIKFMISSSSSTILEEEAIKNLGGRYFLVNMGPLSFTEYLELRGKNKFLKNINLYEKEIRKEFKSYPLKSFPEIIEWDDKLLIKDYLRTTIIDKVIKGDLSERFKNVNKDLLFNLLKIFYNEPGMYLDYDSFSKKLGVSKKTLIDHIFYLEFSYLLRRIRNFRPTMFTLSRKMQRVYSYWGGLAYCYSDNYDKIMENIVASFIDAKYYWRKNDKEIDFLIIENKKIIPVEVKNKKELSKRDLRNMKYFLEKYNIKEGKIIYNGKEDEVKIGKLKIKLIPLWKFLLRENDNSL